MAIETVEAPTHQRRGLDVTTAEGTNSVPQDVLDDLGRVAAERVKDAPPLSARQIDRVVSILRMSESGKGDFTAVRM